MKPTVLIHNVETEEVIEREMTDDEYEIFLAASEKSDNELEQVLLVEEARQSARNKLAALGLDEAEVQAILGL